MKRLRQFFSISLMFIPVLSQSQDLTFTLKGKFHQPVSITTIKVFYQKEQLDSIHIMPDGDFSYSGILSESGEMQIVTSTSAITIWLDRGLTKVYLSEKSDRNGKLKLFIDSVRGSEDTELYNYVLTPRTGKTTEIKFTKPVIVSSEAQMRAFQDSLNKARKPFRDSLFRAQSVNEIDSIFKIRPDSKVLPWLIRFYASVLGIDNMQAFYYKLNTAQQESKAGQDLLKELNKLQLLKRGNIFEDFAMNDDRGKKFHFSSLKSKYVLIEFWASWCGPCRTNNPYLREMYLKSKQAGLEIIGISLDDDKKKWLQAIKQDKLTWINISDLQRHNNAIAVKYKITGIPFSVLLDENRKVVMVNPSTYVITEFFKNL